MPSNITVHKIQTQDNTPSDNTADNQGHTHTTTSGLPTTLLASTSAPPAPLSLPVQLLPASNYLPITLILVACLLAWVLQDL